MADAPGTQAWKITEASAVAPGEHDGFLRLLAAWGQTTGVVKAGNGLHHQAGMLSPEYKEQVPGKGQSFPSAHQRVQK